MPADNTIQFIILVAVISLSFYYFMTPSDPYQNEGVLNTATIDQYTEFQMGDDNASSGNSSDENSATYRSCDSHTDDSIYNAGDGSVLSGDSDDQLTNVSDDTQSIDQIKYRATGPNNAMAQNKKYIYDSYAKMDRPLSKNVEKIFNVNNVITNKPDDFNPSNDDVEIMNAGVDYKVDKKKEEKYKYDINQFTPKQSNKDWFEVIESVDVKNSQLINIYRPIGANTIGSSLKNASLDIRGNVPCPQTVVSPWLQSSIQADHNIKSLC